MRTSAIILEMSNICNGGWGDKNNRFWVYIALRIMFLLHNLWQSDIDSHLIAMNDTATAFMNDIDQ